MRNFAVVLIASVWTFCGSQGHSQEPLLMPGPTSPVTVGHGSGRVLLADINRDGHLDLVTQHLLSSSVAILSGDGKGHFASFDGAPMRLGYQPGTITVGDVNHDGIPDLGVTSRDEKSEYAHVLLGDGRGRFKPMPSSLTLKVISVPLLSSLMRMVLALPCLRALAATTGLPSVVRGPVDFPALRRLASICLMEDIELLD